MEDLVSFLKVKLSQEGITPYQLSQKTGISRDYLSRLLNGKIAQPGIEKLQKIAYVLNFQLSDIPLTHKSQSGKAERLPSVNITSPSNAATADLQLQSQPLSNHADTTPGILSVPTINIVGRSQELDTLEQWIVHDRARVINLWGLPGIGKTTVASAIAQHLHDRFDQIVWLDATLAATKDTLENLDRYPNFLNSLQTQRLLVVLDHLDAIHPSPNNNVASMPTELGKLFQHMTTSPTDSTLLLVSRTRMQWLNLMKGSLLPHTHFWKLQGLKTSARQLLESQGLGSPEHWDELIRLYRGHPLALKLATSVIQTIFGGSVLEFLKQDTLFLGDLNHLLQEQVSNLSAKDQELLQAIAGQTAPVNFTNLYDFLPKHWRKSQMIDSLNTLVSQSLVDVVQVDQEVHYTLQPLVKHFVLHYFPSTEH